MNKIYSHILNFLFIMTLCSCAEIPHASLHEQNKALQLLDQGTLLLRKGELEQARAAFSVSHEVSPSAAALDGIGCVAMLQGRIKSAEHYFVEALQFDPEYSQAAANLALLYESQGLQKQALELYLRAVQLDPSNFKVRNNFAGYLFDNTSRENSKMFRRAFAELRKAEALAAHPLIQENLQKIDSRVRHYE